MATSLPQLAGCSHEDALAQLLSAFGWQQSKTSGSQWRSKRTLRLIKTNGEEFQDFSLVFSTPTPRR